MIRVRIVVPRGPAATRSRWLAGSLAVHGTLLVGALFWPQPSGTSTEFRPVSLVAELPPPLGTPDAAPATAAPEPAPTPEPIEPDPTPPDPTTGAIAIPDDVELDPTTDDDPPADAEPEKPKPTPEAPSTGEASSGTRGRPDGVAGGAGSLDAPADAGGDLGSLFGSRHAWYSRQVEAILRSNWRKPPIEGIGEPVVRIKVDILRDGTIANPRWVERSGVPSLDRSAMRAIEASNPLPAFPKDFERAVVSWTIAFEFGDD